MPIAKGVWTDEHTKDYLTTVQEVEEAPRHKLEETRRKELEKMAQEGELRKQRASSSKQQLAVIVVPQGPHQQMVGRGNELQVIARMGGGILPTSCLH